MICSLIEITFICWCVFGLRLFTVVGLVGF